MALTQRYVSSLAAGGGDGAIATPWTLAEAEAAAVAGDVVNVKFDGAYARGSDFAPAASASTTSPIKWRGYYATIGDLSPGGSLYSRANGAGARVTTYMPLIAFDAGFRVDLATGTITNHIFESMRFTGAYSGALINFNANGVNNELLSCVGVNSSTNAAAVVLSMANRCLAMDNDLTLSGASGGLAAINCVATNARVLYNRIKGGPAAGITISTGSVSCVGNVIYRCATNGIMLTGTTGLLTAIGNTIVNNTLDGIDIAAGGNGVNQIVNNIITDNGGYGIDGNNANVALISAFNRYRNNTLGNIHLATDWAAATGYGDITTGTGTDFVDPTNDDYRLVNGSPALQGGLFYPSTIGANALLQNAGNRGLGIGIS